MKKIFVFMLLLQICLILTSCYREVIVFANMVEYTYEEVLQVAKEKYNIVEYYYTGEEVSKVHEDIDEFSYDNYQCDGIFSNIVNPDNLEKALTSFAGKNGDFKVQLRYEYFACYLALGIDGEGKSKFIYYNVNLDKRDNIIDTIGSSDYPYDVSLSEISTQAMDEITWDSLRMELKKRHGDKFGIRRLDYGFDKPTIISKPSSVGDTFLIQFYKENDQVVFDIFDIEFEGYRYNEGSKDSITSKKLIYSSSSNYEFYFSQYGVDPTEFFNIEYTIEQWPEPNALGFDIELVSGKIAVKEFNKKIINYSFTYQLSCKENVIDNGIIVENSIEGNDAIKDYNFEHFINKIDSHNHAESVDVRIVSFCVIYKKDNVA